MPHLPVLLRETTNLLAIKPGDQVVDCTFGDGGQARVILERLAPHSAFHLLGIDLDPENIERAKKLPEFSQQVILVNDNFSNLKKIVKKYDFGPVRAVLIDLGWSMTQFEKSGRGFSFLKDEPLDMRYDTRMNDDTNDANFYANDANHANDKLTAAEILNKWSEAEIGRILREYGEEKNWRGIARAIVQSRRIKPIKTTSNLVAIIKNLKFKIKNSHLHPATKVFQALRIAVNDELDNLRKVLPQAVEILVTGGRLAVISFHSLEDRIVKQFFKQEAEKRQIQIITKKPVIPSREEIKKNPRSRSAKLRVVERLL